MTNKELLKVLIGVVYTQLLKAGSNNNHYSRRHLLETLTRKCYMKLCAFLRTTAVENDPKIIRLKVRIVVSSHHASKAPLDEDTTLSAGPSYREQWMTRGAQCARGNPWTSLTKRQELLKREAGGGDRLL